MDKQNQSEIMDQQKLREQLLTAKPEWRGRLWINRYSVTVRGLGTAYFPGEEDKVSAQDYLALFELTARRNAEAELNQWQT